jgi:hypothetical protein
VGCSGGGRLNVVDGVQVATDGGSMDVVSLGAGASVAVVPVVVVTAVGLTARAGPLRLLKIQNSSPTIATAATATPMAMVRFRRVSCASPSMLIAECP